MKIYNTLSKTIEEFTPNNGKEVNMYTCGPTVYHFAHIGNLRTYIFEDVLEKSLNQSTIDLKYKAVLEQKVKELQSDNINLLHCGAKPIALI